MKKKIFIGVFTSLFMCSFAYASAGKSVIIDLSTQTATAYENDVPVFSGRVSTGTAKRPTPTGRFRVLEKDIDHVSSSWPKPNGGAKMHYMQRLTNYGIAMHLGFVPNYPASHGCIRLENGLAQKMYEWGRVGMPVRVMGHAPSRVYGRSASNVSSQSKRSRARQIYRPSVSYSTGKRLSALEVLSSSPKKGQKNLVKKKRTKSSKKKIASRKKSKRRYTRGKKKRPQIQAVKNPTPLDMMSSSPKAIKKVEIAQKKKWENAS